MSRQLGLTLRASPSAGAGLPFRRHARLLPSMALGRAGRGAAKGRAEACGYRRSRRGRVHAAHARRRSDQMRRRQLIGLLGAAVVGWPCAARAQSADKVWRIGVFHIGLDHVPETLEGLHDGLRALGYDVGSAPMTRVSAVVSGSNIRLAWRNLADE